MSIPLIDELDKARKAGDYWAGRAKRAENLADAQARLLEESDNYADRMESEARFYRRTVYVCAFIIGALVSVIVYGI